MKKFFFILSIVILLGSCESGNISRLKEMIKTERKRLPIKLETGDYLKVIDYDRPSNIVNLQIQVKNPDLIEVLEKNREICSKYFRLSFMSEDWRLPNAIENVGATVSVKFIDSSQKNEATTVFSPKEFKSLLTSKLTSSEKKNVMLGDIIAVENAGCPRNAGFGQTLAGVSLLSEGVVVDFEFDETELNGTDFQNYLKSVSSVYKAALQNTFSDSMLKYIKEAGLSIIYNWTGNKGFGPFSIIITPDEINIDEMSGL